jgi:ATP-binding cassette subfamily B protein
MSEKVKSGGSRKGKNGIFALLKPYRAMIALLVLFSLIGNTANLIVPRIIAKGIDTYAEGSFSYKIILMQFLTATTVIFLFSIFQTVVQTLTSERVGFKLRESLSQKISGQSFTFIQEMNPSKLLTNLTADVDSIKSFVSLGVSSIVSSVVMIIGTVILLLIIDWELALPVLMIIPSVAITFFIISKKIRVLFLRGREVIDWLNRVINESILGSAIIRVINSQQPEYVKFLKASGESRDIGISIVNLFATLVPLIIFFANLATLTILALGGHFVIAGKLSLGDFAAFNSYVTILVFPIIMIGFMSNVFAQASASFQRIESVLNTPESAEEGTVETELTGKTELKNVSVFYDEKPVLKDISFSIEPGSRTAIIGPTAAGKTQLLYLLTGLIKPAEGTVEFDGIQPGDYKKETFYKNVGIVFQDSVMFNMSLRENVSFSPTVTAESLQKAIQTAGLDEFVDTLPDKLETIVSERGTSLSGGQKQRIMLARALAVNPKILLLDDFTARVDQLTEQKILKRLKENYPEITLISVTQKINPVKDFDKIILLMEGELIAAGKHEQLHATYPEYVQIYESQQSTSHYELQS